MSPFRIVFSAVFIVTIWFGLKPFNFISENDVYHDLDTGKLFFNQSSIKHESHRRGIASAKEEVDFTGWEEISIFFEVESHKVPSGLGMILMIDDNEKQPPLIMAQWLNHLAIRSRRSATPKDRPYQERGLGDCLFVSQPVSLLIVSGSNGTSYFKNGELMMERKDFHLVDSNGSFSGKMIIGNNAQGTSPWHGAMKRIAIFDQAVSPKQLGDRSINPVVDYQFSSERLTEKSPATHELAIPENFKPVFRERILGFNSDHRKLVSNLSDVIINVIGFMPIGLCFYIILRKLKLNKGVVAMATLIACAAMSTLIELGQVFLPTRDSSLLDLLCNTAGGGLAIIAGLIWQR